MAKPQAELQGLFAQFAAPLGGAEFATLPADIRTEMAQTLWRAMIEGPDTEAEALSSLGDEHPLELELQAAIERCYRTQMRPLVSDEDLASLQQWYQKGPRRAFAVGDKVRVRYGVNDPDYYDLPLGGWTGTIRNINRNGMCTIRVSQFTRDHVDSIYRRRCDRDGLKFGEIVLQHEDLDPDLGEGLPLEPLTDVETEPLDLDNQNDRIRLALGLTSDDAIAAVNEDTLEKYREFLKASLVFPFSATDLDADEPEETEQQVTVIGLSEAEVNVELGLEYEVRNGDESLRAPLFTIEIDEDNPNFQHDDDYCVWFNEAETLAEEEAETAWGHSKDEIEGWDKDDWEEDDEEWDEEWNEGWDKAADQEPPPKPTTKPAEKPRLKAGRNDPCPCGSGKKFKKCCLNKPPADKPFFN